MAERRIRVTLDPSGVERGTARAGRAVNRLQGETRDLRGTLLRAAGALGGIVIAQRALTGLIQYSDTWALTANRLRLVTNSSEELARTQADLISLAGETFQRYEPTVELYSRLTRATETLNLSQRQNLAIVRGVNQAVAISGATASEASAGLIQFAQGLASGRFQGDELRSVLEQLPRLGQAIAAGLGVTVGQLRELGAQGKLTREALVTALLSELPQLTREFANLQPTIGQSTGAIGDALLGLFGAFEQVTQIGGGVAEYLQSVARSLRIVGGSASEIDLLVRRISGLRRELGELETSIDFSGNQGQQIESLRLTIFELTGQLEGLRNEQTRVDAETERSSAANQRNDRVIQRLVARYADLAQGVGLAREAHDLLRLATAGASQEQLAAVRANVATIQAYERRIEAAESLAAAEQSLRSITAQELAPFVRQQEVEDAEELSRIIQDQALPAFSAFDIVTQRLSVSQRELAESEQAVTAELQASIDAIDMAAEAQQRLEEEVRQTEVANQRFAEQLASNITSSFEDAILGARGFGSAVAGLAEDMVRLILRITVLQPLAESLLATFNRGGGGAGSGIGNFLSSVLSGLVSGSPGAPVAASGPSRTPGFQFGGAFTVPGTGGPDSQNVFFRASPGERVTVSPASAQPRITINNYAGPDTSVETQTRSGPSGEQVVEVIVRKSLDRMSRTGELGKILGQFGVRPTLIAR